MCVKKTLELTVRRIFMRHFYIRMILGIVFVVCMIYSLITENFYFALFYLVLGAMLLISAYSLWKKNKQG